MHGFFKYSTAFTRDLVFKRVTNIFTVAAISSYVYADLSNRSSFRLAKATDVPPIKKGFRIARNSLIRGRDAEQFAQDYDLLECVGKGGFAAVWKARHKRTGQIRAVKIIDIITTDELHRFQQEVSIMTKLESPYTARLIEYYYPNKTSVSSEKNSVGVIVYHYIDGCDILESINRRILKKSQELESSNISSTVREMLKALSYIHHLGILHGDVKPENFMQVQSSATQSLGVQLIDFGLSVDQIAPSNCSAQNKPSPASGRTCFYSAPEVLSGSYFSKSDVFSVGIIMSILLSGSDTVLKEAGDLEKDPAEWISSVGSAFSKLHSDVVTKGAIDLMLKLINPSTKLRLTADEALQHPYLADMEIAVEEDTTSWLQYLELSSKRSFLANILRLMVVVRMSDSETHSLRTLFSRLDSNHDGIVTIDDLENASSCPKYDRNKLIHFVNSVSLRGISNGLTYEEFLAIALPEELGPRMPILLNIFEDLQQENSESIDASSLTMYFKNSAWTEDISGQILSSCKNVAEAKRSSDGLSFGELKRCFSSSIAVN